MPSADFTDAPPNLKTFMLIDFFNRKINKL